MIFGTIPPLIIFGRLELRKIRKFVFCDLVIHLMISIQSIKPACGRFSLQRMSPESRQKYFLDISGYVKYVKAHYGNTININ